MSLNRLILFSLQKGVKWDSNWKCECEQSAHTVNNPYRNYRMGYPGMCAESKRKKYHRKPVCQGQYERLNYSDKFVRYIWKKNTGNI